MSDFENKLFTEVATALEAAFTGINVLGTYVEETAQFPCVVFQQTNSITYRQGRTLDDIDNFARVTYEANVYSAKQNGRKTEATAIADKLCDIMSGIGFTRTYYGSTPNLDRSIYRMTLRWDAIVSKADYKGNPNKHLVFAD